MDEYEFKEPSKINLIERIVEKSAIHENEIDGKCIYISLEHIHLLIKSYNDVCKDIQYLRKIWLSDKEKYRSALKEAVVLIEKKKFDEAEEIILDAIGEW